MGSGTSLKFCQVLKESHLRSKTRVPHLPTTHQLADWWVVTSEIEPDAGNFYATQFRSCYKSKKVLQRQLAIGLPSIS